MTIGDQLNSLVYPALMKHGTDDILMKNINMTLSRLELILTGKFFGGDYYQMVDLYIFPWISRIFYTENSVMHSKVYMKINPRVKYPNLSAWFDTMKAHPDFTGREHNEKIVPYMKKDRFTVETVELNPIVPKAYFQLWLEELVQTPVGKKPPLRYPFRFKKLDGREMMAKM